MILTPTNEIKLHCFVDADFAGLWLYEDPHDPVCVRSRTGYVMTFSGVPIIWKSKLQTKTALITMEAEYIALSITIREMLPLRELIIEVCDSIGLEMKEISTMHNTIWEDNQGCFILANLELPRMKL